MVFSHHWAHDFLWYSLTSLTHDFLWYSLTSLNSWLFMVFPHITELMIFYGILTSLNSWLFMVFSHITELMTFYGIPSNYWTRDFSSTKTFLPQNMSTPPPLRPQVPVFFVANSFPTHMYSDTHDCCWLVQQFTAEYFTTFWHQT